MDMVKYDLTRAQLCLLAEYAQICVNIHNMITYGKYEGIVRFNGSSVAFAEYCGVTTTDDLVLDGSKFIRTDDLIQSFLNDMAVFCEICLKIYHIGAMKWMGMLTNGTYIGEDGDDMYIYGNAMAAFKLKYKGGDVMENCIKPWVVRMLNMIDGVYEKYSGNDLYQHNPYGWAWDVLEYWVCGYYGDGDVPKPDVKYKISAFLNSLVGCSDDDMVIINKMKQVLMGMEVSLDEV